MPLNEAKQRLMQEKEANQTSATKTSVFVLG
jgi:hypothetical protein